MFVFNSSIRNSKDANPNLQKEKKNIQTSRDRQHAAPSIRHLSNHWYIQHRISSVLCTHKIYQIIIYSWKDVKIFRPALILFVYLEIDTVTREQDKTGCFLEFLRHWAFVVTEYSLTQGGTWEVYIVMLWNLYTDL